jgi:hypothetical protein
LPAHSCPQQAEATLFLILLTHQTDIHHTAASTLSIYRDTSHSARSILSKHLVDGLRIPEESAEGLEEKYIAIILIG